MLRPNLTAPVLLVCFTTLACRTEPARPVMLEVDGTRAVAQLDERYLSVAVDSAQAFGGKFWSASGETSLVGDEARPPLDFARAKLRRLARELAPAYLRIGGSMADEVFYDLSAAPGAAPEHFDLVLTRREWDGIASFARELGFELVFTLNAGRGPRNGKLEWSDEQARSLIGYAAGRGDPVAVWELGNEINGFPLLLGFYLSPAQYAADLRLLRAASHELTPAAKVAGPASAYWPLDGELNAVLPGVLREGGDALDVVTWHYYPQQSRRCPVATLRAYPELPLEPARLDMIATWGEVVETARGEHAPQAEIWLGESGGAQCGGEPGVNDRFVGGFWWMDQLGLVARRGHRVSIRQSLTGANYGLLDEDTLEPRPDYWTSVLWKRLMGTGVLDVKSEDDHLRAYAHCARGGEPGAVAIAALNLDRSEARLLDVRGLSTHGARAFVLTADALDSAEIRLGGRALSVGKDGSPPPLEGTEVDELRLPPTSYGFFLLPNAGAEGCR